MSSLVEKVARAICASAMEGSGPRVRASFDQLHENERAYTLRLARSAMAAMREPTDADFGGRFGSEPRRLFTDMIDAALSEARPSGPSIPPLTTGGE